MRGGMKMGRIRTRKREMSERHKNAMTYALKKIQQSSIAVYMKNVIDKYFKPETEEEQTEYDIHMRTHNLNKLMRFLDQRMGLNFDREVKAEMQIINGYYFTARYPGDESIEVTKEDLDVCADAVEHCRESILKMIREIENELNENEKS